MTETLKSLRIAQGLTQENLADKLGVSPLTVFLWEHGKRYPRPGNVPRLAKVLHVAPEDLILLLNTNKHDKVTE